MTAEIKSPYCELCDGCGEDGCCSHINCMYALVKANPSCKYGETYLSEARLNKNVTNMVFELMERMENETDYTKEQFIKDFNSNYDKLWNDERNRQTQAEEDGQGRRGEEADSHLEKEEPSNERKDTEPPEQGGAA